MGIYKSKFDIGQSVYLKTDPENFARLIIGVEFRTSGVTYILCLGDFVTGHTEIEISLEPTFINKSDEKFI